MARRKATAKGVVRRYESVTDLAGDLKNMPQLEAWNKTSMFRHGNDDPYVKRWSGETPSDATKKLVNGDAELAAKIKAQGKILAESGKGTCPKLELGVYGCIPSVPNYLRGVPTNMLRVIREPRRNPVIDIYVENSIYDGIDTDKVAMAAACIANVIYATEQAGVRVNLYAVNTANDTEECEAHIMITKIKDAKAPLNLLNIAFAVCNRAMHRNVFLRWLERYVDKRLWGYGTPMKRQEVVDTFGLDGVVLSIRDMVDNRYGIEYVEENINEYIKNK